MRATALTGWDARLHPSPGLIRPRSPLDRLENRAADGPQVKARWPACPRWCCVETTKQRPVGSETSLSSAGMPANAMERLMYGDTSASLHRRCFSPANAAALTNAPSRLAGIVMHCPSSAVQHRSCTLLPHSGEWFIVKTFLRPAASPAGLGANPISSSPTSGRSSTSAQAGPLMARPGLR
jgi:hypothetical protein